MYSAIVKATKGTDYRPRQPAQARARRRRAVRLRRGWLLLMADKLRVLFICTHNSARSQMAEGLLRHIAGDEFDVYSAGTEATSVGLKRSR